MESGYSLFNPGGSLNFEIPAQIHEEDEAAEDERIKEKELQDLLTNAFDDLIDDDEDEGSIQHDSPTQNSIHSESNFSGSNLAKHLPYQNMFTQHNNNNPAEKIPLHSPFNVFENQHNTAEETNEKFQEMDPETFNGDSSVDFGSSSRENSRMEQPLNKEWEGQYYVDQWGDGHSGDQLQSGLLDNHLVNGIHQQQIQQKMTNGIHSGDSKEILAYHPYHVEVGEQNTIKFKKQTVNENEEYQRQQLISSGGESGDQIKLQQLQILYNARGREIQRLEQTLETLKEEMDVEIGNMTNRFTAIKNENGKYASSLQASQGELDSAKNVISKLDGQLRATELQLSSVTINRNEVVQKLQAADSAIESLEVQIEELHKSENLNRARQNHATMLQSMTEKHNQEVYYLKMEIKDIKDLLQSKEAEVEKLQEKLNRVACECDEIKLDKAETVNRLLKALEESQNECQNLMQDSKKPPSISPSPQEAKSFNDEIVLRLKEELVATQRELDLYVSAARHGAIGQDNVTSSTTNQMQSKAIGNSYLPSLMEDDSLLSTLKSEVERSLSCLQNKNEQLRRLQATYQTAQSKIKTLQNAAESSKCSYLQSQVKVTALMKELQDAKETYQKSDRSEEIRTMKMENKSLNTELNKAKQYIEDLSSSTDLLNDQILNLKDEIANLKQVHDEEKQRAVNDCRDACLQLHDDAIRANREETERHLNEIQRNNQQQVRLLTQELDEVKTLYVTVCEEKNQLENDLLQKWQEAKGIEIEELTKSWATEMGKKIQLMKDDLAKQYHKNKHNPHVNEEDFINKVKAEVAKQTEERLKKAKILWEKEQELFIEERASTLAKELILDQKLVKSPDNSESTIDNYLQHIEELENRVKQTEDLYKQHLTDLEMEMNQKKAEDLKKLEERLSEAATLKLKEMQILNAKELTTTIKNMEFKFQKEKQKLLTDIKSDNNSKVIENLKKQLHTVDVTMKQQLNDLVEKIEEEKSKAVKDAILKAEEDKRRALAEGDLRKDLLNQEKLQALVQKKDKEKDEALILLEQKLCADLDSFLDVQKQRFLMALKNMQESHAKEKVELQNSYEIKISQLREEYKTSMESQQLELLAHTQQVKSNANEETCNLQSNVKSLEDKCQKIERDMLQVINDLKKQLRIKDVELENQMAEFTEYQEKLTKPQEDYNFTSFKHEISTLKLQVSKAEEQTNQYKLQVEEAEASYQNLVTRHSNLKEKVKKYHRYIHGKEKEFAISLTKITEEHKSALEKVFSMKTEVLLLLDHKLEELRRHILQTYSTADIPAVLSTHMQKPNSSRNPVKGKSMDDRRDLENGITLLKDNFAQSIKNIHADIMSYLEDCNHYATSKIQEEVTKASWLLSEHLGMPAPNEPSAKKKSSLRQSPVLSQEHVTSIGSRSQTPTPELVTNYSSGRGTMVGNPSSQLNTVETAQNTESQTFTKEKQCLENLTQPLKFWSSTPFSREFPDGTSIPLLDRPMPGLSKRSPVIPGAETFVYGLAKGIPPDKPPFSNYLSNISPPTLTFSNVTWKSTQNCSQNPDNPTFPDKLPSAAKTAKFKSMAHQILSQSAQNTSSAPSLPTGSEERKSRYVAFNNNLTVLKHDFWHGIDDAGTTNAN